jgi:polysaccharide deacetylase family protein (PEP-CTERM system associated)
MTVPVTFTLDLEDVRTSAAQPDRVPAVTTRVLDRMAQRGIRGTVFVVGELARAHPDLVRRAHADGHEIGLHAHRHVGIDKMGGPDAFARDTAAAKAELEGLIDAPVHGYRAPIMSLVPETSWAVEILAGCGFTYSSSTLPARNPLYGWPGLPQRPFRWAGAGKGLVELPCPVVSIGPATVPYLGGTYVRVFPDIVRRTGMRRAAAGAALWTYCHPWEFDHGAPLTRMAEANWAVTLVGRINRRRMLGRVQRAIGDHPGPPLRDVAASLDPDALPLVDPATGAPAEDTAVAS